MELSQKIAEKLLEIGAVKLDFEKGFTWVSGIQSPIYCDNRMTISYPQVRELIADSFIQLMEKNNIKPDIIAGTATAGIPHSTLLAHKLNLPMLYVRSEPKKHGKGNQIEGYYEKNQSVLLIEDLVSTGKSSIGAIKALEEEGLKVLDCYAIFSYGFKKADISFSENKKTYLSLSNIEALISLCKNKKLFTATELASLSEFLKDK